MPESTTLDRSRRALRLSWITFAVFLAVFIAAALSLPETPASRAHHRQVTMSYALRLPGHGTRSMPIVARPAWRAAPWTDTLRAWDHAAFFTVNRRWDNRLFDRAMPLFTKLGDGGVEAVLFLLLLGWAIRTRRNEVRRTALMGIVGVIAGIAAPILKLVLPRYRPPAVFPFQVNLLVHPLYGGSFPSGHTFTAFCIATILARRHRWTTPWAFGLAALVGISRMSVGVHWPLDVLGGMVLGIASGLVITWLWARRENRAAREIPPLDAPSTRKDTQPA